MCIINNTDRIAVQRTPQLAKSQLASLSSTGKLRRKITRTAVNIRQYSPEPKVSVYLLNTKDTEGYCYV
jgi:hypothetical protein